LVGFVRRSGHSLPISDYHADQRTDKILRASRGSAITRSDHVIEKESPNFNELQLVLIERIKQLLLDML
jgi:hypothetical protein